MRAQLRVGRDQLGAFRRAASPRAAPNPATSCRQCARCACFHLDACSGLCDALAFARDPSLQQARRLLRLRQLLLLVGEFAPGSFQSVSRLLETRLTGAQRPRCSSSLCSPVVALRAKLRKLRIETLRVSATKRISVSSRETSALTP